MRAHRSVLGCTMPLQLPRCAQLVIVRGSLTIAPAPAAAADSRSAPRPRSCASHRRCCCRCCRRACTHGTDFSSLSQEMRAQSVQLKLANRVPDVPRRQRPSHLAAPLLLREAGCCREGGHPQMAASSLQTRCIAPTHTCSAERMRGAWTSWAGCSAGGSGKCRTC